MSSFAGTAGSEAIKLSSLRSVRVMTALCLLLGVALTCGLAIAVGGTWPHWTPDDQASFEPISTTLAGVLPVTVFLVMIGTSAATSEYASGIVRVTFAVTPNRGRVVAAKALVVGILALVTGLVTTTAMFLAGQAILSGYGLPHASLTDGAAFRAVMTTGLLSALLPVIAVAVGLALRSTAGTLVSVVALVMVPGILAEALPRGARHVFDYFPENASDAITTGHLSGSSPNLLWPGTAAAMLALWVAGFLGLAWYLVRRRDA